MSALLTHHVLKKFEDDGVIRLVGECVNALGWRTTEAMVSQRMIAPLPEGIEPVGDTEGRFWTGPEWLERHHREPLTQTDDEEPKPEFPTHHGGPWWLLSNGEKVRGKTKAVEAEKALQN